MKSIALFSSIAMLNFALPISSAQAFSLVTDRALFSTHLAGQSIIIDDGNSAFGAAPVAAKDQTDVFRSATLGQSQLAYRVRDVEYGFPTGKIAQDSKQTSTLAIEKQVTQSTAKSKTWGVDSVGFNSVAGSKDSNRPNAMWIDFTASTQGGISYFGVDLVDFESKIGELAAIRLYDSQGELSQSLDFPSVVEFNGKVQFVGIVQDAADLTQKRIFSHALFVLGYNASQKTHLNQWAASAFTFQSPVVSANPVILPTAASNTPAQSIPESMPTPAMLPGLLAVLWQSHRRQATASSAA
jgi:hypothetical protein